MASSHEDSNAEHDNDLELTPRDNGVSQRCSSVEHDNHLRNSVMDIITFGHRSSIMRSWRMFSNFQST
jgi:hypothetical protein